MKNKGFTLIELLAVITIMGILMLVGIPAINRVIENTRKDNYVDTAKKYVNAVKRLWVTDQLFCGNNNITSAAVEEGDYYILIDSSNYDLYTNLLEQGGKSSWGNRDVKGYVRVNVSLSPSTGKQEVKYYIALSDKIHAIYDDKGNEVEADSLVRGDLVMSLDDDSMEEIEIYPFTSGNVTTCSENSYGNVTATVTGGGNGSDAGSGIISVVSGSKDVVGSEVTVGGENFYVIGKDGDNIKLLTKFGLSKTEFKQDVNNTNINSNLEPFSSSNYWNGTGVSYPRYVYGNVSSTYNDIEKYKNYLTTLGVSVVDARLINMPELNALGCHKETYSCSGYEFVYSISYWTGLAANATEMYTVESSGDFEGYCKYNAYRSIRPVIVVPSSLF